MISIVFALNYGRATPIVTMLANLVWWRFSYVFSPVDYCLNAFSLLLSVPLFTLDEPAAMIEDRYR